MQKKGNKRGQVTIFIIIAVLIVGIVALVYFLIPKAQTGTSFNVNNPGAFIQNCLEERVSEVVSTLSNQGGSVSPEFYVNYEGNQVQYLCYADGYLINYCKVQPPGVFLQQHIESEIKEAIAQDVASCFANLQENYRADGYTPNLQNGDINVFLLPRRILVNLSAYSLTVSKAETSTYDSFRVVVNNNLYELVAISNSIIDWESTYGDAEVTIYMSYYEDLLVTKNKADVDSKVYVLTNLDTEDKFQFAVRGGVLPSGYGIAGLI